MTQDELRKELTYDPESGIFQWFVWRRGRRNSLRADSREGSRGYRSVLIQGKRLQASRAAWIYTHGEIPPRHVVDHINGDPGDNRLVNLRIVTQAENVQNQSRRGYGKSEALGVAASGRKWRVHGTVDGRVTYIGTFTTKKEAAAFSHHWRLCNHPGYIGREA